MNNTANPLIRILISACMCLAVLTGFGEESYKLRPSAAVAGSTPGVLAYTMGHFQHGSNAGDWFRYSEAGGFRVWASPPVIEGNDDNDAWGDGVTDWDSFLSRRMALRQDPLDLDFINWPVFEKGYASMTSSSSRLIIREVLDHGAENGLVPLVMIHRGVGTYPFNDSASRIDWESRWECWQHYYAQAFWLGRNYGVERFQVYNEPDHTINLRLSQQEYLERLKLASDAVQCALEDVNRLYGKRLVPAITAPVTTSGVTKYHARPDKEGNDRRDVETGWGELVMDHRTEPMFPDAPDDFANFNVYAYQQYGRNGPSFADQYREIRRLVTEANEGQPLPVWITEFNVLANYQFRKTEDTMHTPARAARLGSILVNLINEVPNELYVFKFGQTSYGERDEYTAKNGNYWQENEIEPYNTGGSTRGAEACRLVTRAFHKDRQLLSRPQWIGKDPGDTWSGASFDPETGLYHLFMVTEESKEATPVELDLSEWGLQLPTLAIMEEVSVTRHGTVRALLQIPEDGRVRINMSPESVCLLTLPKTPFRFSLLPAAADAHVVAGSSRTMNFGGEKRLVVSGHASRSNDRSAAYLKFTTGDLPVAQARRILLRLNLRATSAKEVIPAHVYGLADSTWNEESIACTGAPNLDLDKGGMRSIADNRVSGQGTSAFMLGTATATASFEDQFIDVTGFVRQHAAEPAFLLTQEVRYPGELIYDGKMEIHSRENGPQLAPQLVFLF